MKQILISVHETYHFQDEHVELYYCKDGIDRELYPLLKEQRN